MRGRGVDGGEFLQTLHAPEPLHRSLSTLEWHLLMARNQTTARQWMRILCSVVYSAACLLQRYSADFLECRSVSTRFVSHDHLWLTMLTRCFSEEFQRAFLSRRLVT